MRVPTMLIIVQLTRTVGAAPGTDPDYFFRLRDATLPPHQVLNLVNNTALPPPFARMATWGGSVVRDPTTGLYHIFAAGFVGLNGSVCGLSSWESNSLVLTGSGPSPAGPFSATDHLSIAVGTFAHNPEVVYSPKERKYLLFILGYANSSTAYACDARGEPQGHYANGIPPWLGTVSLHTADNPNGPWSKGTVLAHGTNANPTAWVDATTGEITLLYGRFDKPHRPHKRYYSVLRAKSFTGPWRSLGDLPASLNPPSNCSSPEDPSSPWARCWCNNEDPFLFKLRGRWHLLFHQYTLPTAPNNKSELCEAFDLSSGPPDPSLAVVGGHAVSTGDDVTGEWKYNYWRAAYGMNVSWFDTTTAFNESTTATVAASNFDYPSLYRRERPKVLFDEIGEPQWLYNGVCLDAGGGATNDPGGRNCFTLAQQIESVESV